MLRRCRFLGAFAILLCPAVALAVRIEVFPGSGTPLGDAIAAAAPRDLVVLHAGTYGEAVVADRQLRIRTAGDGEVRIDASSTGAAVALDIAADGVSLVGKNFSRVPGGTLRVYGGTQQAIRIANVTGCTMRWVSDVDPSAPYPFHAEGLMIDASTRVTVTRSFFSGRFVGVHIAGIALGDKVKITRTSMLGSDFDASTIGLLIEDSTVGGTLGRGGIVIAGGKVLAGHLVNNPPAAIIGRGTALVLRNTDGVRFTSAHFGGTAGGLPVVAAIDLDAASDANEFRRAAVGGDVLDAGTGNCGRKVTYGSGTGTLAPC
jgi:hypothetical protein